MTPEELVTVATFENAVGTSVARGAPEAVGIPAFVPDETLGVFALSRSVPPGSWAELKVRLGDRERAVKVLKQAGHR
jgi:hypothetical protein